MPEYEARLGMSSLYLAVNSTRLKVNKTIKLLLRIILSGGAIFMVLRKVDLNQAWEYLKEARIPFLLAAVLAFFLSKVIAVYRLNHFYRTQGIQFKDLQILKLSWLSMFYNLFIPFVGGEGYKAYWIKKRSDVPLKSLVWSALIDRGSGLTALVLVTGVFFYFSNFAPPNKALFYLLIPLAYIGNWAVTRIFFKSFLPAWGITQLLSLPVQFLQAVTAYMVMLSLGIDTAVLDYIFVFMLATFAYIVPLIGAREMAFVFGADALGLSMEVSLAIGLLFYLSLAFNSLLGTYFIFNPKAVGEEVGFRLNIGEEEKED